MMKLIEQRGKMFSQGRGDNMNINENCHSKILDGQDDENRKETE
jgi:hypothetical protein